MEIWKQILDFPEYEVSSLGRVRNCNGYILQGTVTREGYRVVGLRKDFKTYTKKVSRLVGLSFLTSVEGKTEIDHLNKDRADDRIENLKWANRSEQMINTYDKTDHRCIYKTKCNTYKVDIIRDRRHIYNKTFKTLAEAIGARDSYLVNINSTTADSSS